MLRGNFGWRTSRWRQPALSGAAMVPNAAVAAPSVAVPQDLGWKPWQHVPLGLAIIGATLYAFQVHSYKLPIGNIATGVVLLGVVMSGRIRINRTFAFTLLLLIWAFTMSSMARYPAISRDTVIDFGKVWLVSWAIYNTLKDRYHVRYFIFAWLALFALYPVRGAYFNHFICHCAEWGRIGWNFVYSNPNDLAALTFVPMGLCAGILVSERHKLWRIVSLTGLAVLLLLVLLTQSRGAFLALAVTGLFVLIRAPNRKRNFKIGALAAIAAIPFAPSGVWDRIAGLRNASTGSNMVGVDEEGSAEGRWRTWKLAGTLIKESPVIGHGPGMYRYEHWALAKQKSENKTARGLRDAHSTYLLITAELGLVGLGLFLTAIVLTLGLANKARRMVRAVNRSTAEQLLFLELGFVGFLLTGIFSSFPYLSYLHIYLALLAAFSEAAIAQSKGAQLPANVAARARGFSAFARPAALRASPNTR